MTEKKELKRFQKLAKFRLFSTPERRSDVTRSRALHSIQFVHTPFDVQYYVQLTVNDCTHHPDSQFTLGECSAL